MRKIIYIVFLIQFSVSTWAQNYDNETVCSPDTITINPNIIPRHIQKRVTNDSIHSYRIITCEKKSKFGFRMEVGSSHYWYNQKTKDWLGNHFGPNFNFILVYDKLNFGFRFKPFTVNPVSELQFRSETLTKEAKLNPIKLDFYTGYSFDFKFISIEPYLGVSKNSFNVINQENLNKHFSIPNTIGFINGVTLNKYFKIRKYEYISLFSSIGYSIVDFQNVHSSLGKNYLECSLGLAYKGFLTKVFTKRIK